MPQAWVISEYSGYHGLELRQIDVQEPGWGEVRLRVEAFALNWGDMDLMHDRYSFSFPSFPASIGMEAAGIVEAVGDGVSDVELGARYCTLPYFYYSRGASTESLIVPDKYITRAPEHLTAVESASIWMQYMTAYYPLVELGRAGPDKCVLVGAATGTAGTAAVEIGRRCGAKVIATTRYERNREFLKEAGADVVHIQGSDDLSAQIMALSDGAGVDIVFDPVGAGLIQAYRSALAKNACIYFYGMLDGKFPELPMLDMFKTNTRFHPYSLFNYVEHPEMQRKGVKFVNELLSSGAVKPRIDKVYSMQDYKKSWEYLSAPREAHGKVVIKTGL